MSTCSTHMQISRNADDFFYVKIEGEHVPASDTNTFPYFKNIKACDSKGDEVILSPEEQTQASNLLVDTYHAL